MTEATVPAACEADVLKAILSKVDDDKTLCSLSDIKSVRAWDFSFPTLTRPRGSTFTPRNTYASDAPFFQSIQAHNHGLTHSLLKAVGALDETEQQSVVLYGGALVDLIMRRDVLIKDWDLRLVGAEYVGNQEKCLEAARKFVDAVLQWIRNENDNINMRNKNKEKDDDPDEPTMKMENFTIARASSTLTLTIPTKGIKLHKINEEFGPRRTCSRDTVMQFTFAPYSDVHELFSGARPHCTRIAIWRGKIVFPPIARYCLESCCIMLDTRSLLHCKIPTEAEGDGDASTDTIDRTSSMSWELLTDNIDRARSMSWELRRVLQYFQEKGFDVILPDLDISKVPRRNLKYGAKEVLDLPLLTVILNEIHGSKIVVDRWSVHSKPIRDDDSEEDGEPDEDVYNSTSIYGYDSATDLNAGTVIHHNLKCLIAGVYDKFQFFTEGEVVDPVFDFCPKLTPRMVQFAFQTVRSKFDEAKDLLPVSVVLHYFRATPPDQVFEKLILKPMKEFMQGGGGGGKPNYRFKLDKKALKEIIEREKQDVIQNKLPFMRNRMIESGLDKFGLDFLTKVSSMDEIAAALYGKYLKTK